VLRCRRLYVFDCRAFVSFYRHVGSPSGGSSAGRFGKHTCSAAHIENTTTPGVDYAGRVELLQPDERAAPVLIDGAAGKQSLPR